MASPNIKKISPLVVYIPSNKCDFTITGSGFNAGTQVGIAGPIDGWTFETKGNADFSILSVCAQWQPTDATPQLYGVGNITITVTNDDGESDSSEEPVTVVEDDRLPKSGR